MNKALLASTLIFSLSSFTTLAQKINFTKWKIKSSIFGEAAYSDFRYNTKELQHFPSAEFRIGITVEKKINSAIGIYSGTRLGLKKRTTSDVDLSQFPANPYLFFENEIGNSIDIRNHYFIEIPIGATLQVKKIQFLMGVNSRYFIDNNIQEDFISGAFDFGASATLKLKLNEKMSMSLSYLYNLIALYKSGIVIIEGEEIPEVKGYLKTLGLSLEYRLN